jgi:hypothetical protein
MTRSVAAGLILAAGLGFDGTSVGDGQASRRQSPFRTWFGLPFSSSCGAVKVSAALCLSILTQ